MSTLDAKLEPVRHTEGRARRRLSTLRACWGYEWHGGTEKRPERVTVCPMDRPSTWARVDGDRDGDPLYELEVQS